MFHYMPTVLRLVLRITFIAFSVAKPFGPSACSAAEAHEMRELCFVKVYEVELCSPFRAPVFVPVSVLRDLVPYERKLVVHRRFQSHP